MDGNVPSRLPDRLDSNITHGSLTCKTRKLKCDEAKPVCGQCSKGPRECIYVERRVFRSVEVHSPSKRARRRTSSFSEDEQSVFDEDHIWVHVPTDCGLVKSHRDITIFDLTTYHSDVYTG